MSNFITLGGLPRTGSTLLCNILNQNPDFFASSTSPIPMVIQNMSNSFSEQPEIVNYLVSEEDCYRKMANCARAVIDQWYSDREEKYIIDKSRLWNCMSLIYSDLYPDGKMIITVRDPRNIMASMEKQYRRSPLLAGSHIIQNKDLIGRIENSFSPDGMIGGAMLGVIDLIARKMNNVLFVRYEDLISSTDRTLDDIYKFLDIERYEHNLDNIESISNEVDEMYQNKFPHKVKSTIKPSTTDWRDYIEDNLAMEILNKYPVYKNRFHYQ